MGARKSVSLTVLPGSTVALINEGLIQRLISKFSPEIVEKTGEETQSGSYQFNKKIRLIVEYRGDEEIPSKRPPKGEGSTKTNAKKTVTKEKAPVLTENTAFNLAILDEIKKDIKAQATEEGEEASDEIKEEEKVEAENKVDYSLFTEEREGEIDENALIEEALEEEEWPEDKEVEVSTEEE
jgi:hypothetical protein